MRLVKRTSMSLVVALSLSLLSGCSCSSITIPESRIVKFKCPEQTYEACTQRLKEICQGDGHIYSILSIDDMTYGQCATKE